LFSGCFGIADGEADLATARGDIGDLSFLRYSARQDFVIAEGAQQFRNLLPRRAACRETRNGIRI
jgi:hypothetical protein